MPKRIKNGNLELFYSNRIYLVDEAPVEVPVEFGGRDRMILIFDIKYDGGETVVSFAPLKTAMEATQVFTIRNFGVPLGSFLKTPIKVGDIDGRDIKIRFGVIKPNDSMPILDISVYAEVLNNGK